MRELNYIYEASLEELTLDDIEERIKQFYINKELEEVMMRREQKINELLK